MQAIYAPIVLSTFISFETQAPTVEQMRERVLAAHPRYPWLVAAEGDLVTGYARASRHREREAYQWSVGVSVYVHDAHRGSGPGIRASADTHARAAISRR